MSACTSSSREETEVIPALEIENMLALGRKILAIQEHIAFARNDYYHNVANRLLRFGLLGEASPKRGSHKTEK
jgi:hypothetical protein